MDGRLQSPTFSSACRSPGYSLEYVKRPAVRFCDSSFHGGERHDPVGFQTPHSAGYRPRAPPSTPGGLLTPPSMYRRSEDPHRIQDPQRIHRQGVLKVTLKKGTGLKAADMNGKSDPYVIVSSGRQEKRSRTIKKTLDPEWNEVLEFEGNLKDFLSHGLTLKVMGWDRLSSDDPLGDAQVSLEELKWNDSAEYSEGLTTQGSVAFSVAWEALTMRQTQTGVLHVHLSHAVGLKAMDRNGFSDPYVKLSLKGQQHKSKTIKKTLDPKWDEGFEFKGELRELISDPLQLHVFDKDWGSSDDKLGNASVDLRELEVNQRMPITSHLNTQGTVHLTVSWRPDRASSSSDAARQLADSASAQGSTPGRYPGRLRSPFLRG